MVYTVVRKNKNMDDKSFGTTLKNEFYTKDFFYFLKHKGCCNFHLILFEC